MPLGAVYLSGNYAGKQDGVFKTQHDEKRLTRSRDWQLSVVSFVKTFYKLLFIIKSGIYLFFLFIILGLSTWLLPSNQDSDGFNTERS